MYYIYELINLMGGIEHIGQTTKPEIRFQQHTRKKPNHPGTGKFYRRQDISMHIVASYESKKQALQAEYDLQIFWGLSADRDKVKGEKSKTSKLTEDKVKEIKLLLSKNVLSSEIAKKFNIGRRNVDYIKSGKIWSQIY